MPVPMPLPAGYTDWLAAIKARVQAARTRAVLAVNAEQVQLYWEIGREILSRQSEAGWGAKILDRLSQDLRAAFPEAKGFSVTNLKYMRRFAETCPDRQFGQQAADQLPWFHIVVLLTQLADPLEREWYAAKAIAHGWSRNILSMQIEVGACKREGKAISNFSSTLPAYQSDLVQQSLKDPYLFDFLGLGDEAHERDIENALTHHITRFLLELGVGFAYVGRQFPLKVGGEDFYLDLLFYHLKLRCYVVLELKAGAFKPEHAGKLNFYISAVDGTLKHETDNPSIGVLLCKKKDKVVAEYALKDINKPIGIAEYRLTDAIPENLRGSLPSIEELEDALRQAETEQNDA